MKKKSIFEPLKWFDPFTYLDMVLEKVWPRNKKSKWQEAGYDLIYLVFAFLVAFVLYTILSLAWQTSSPMVIVVSGSMEPVLYRGDVVFLHGIQTSEVSAPEVDVNAPLTNAVISNFLTPHYADNQIESISFENNQSVPIQTTGDIIVYNSPLLGEQIIHRAIAKLNATDGTFLLTKGDSVYNTTFDQDCGSVQVLPLANGQVKILTEKACITPFAVSQEQLQGKVQFAPFKIPLVGCVKLWLVDDLVSLIRTHKLPANFQGIC
ncbi:MAG: hypothetical protein V1847_04510 [Candidatus Diapherotrites archaeon]